MLAAVVIDVRDWEARGARVDVRGHRIFVVDEGEPRDGTVLFLHGFPNSSWTFNPLLPLDGYRTVLVDMLGYGSSSKPFDRPYDLFEQADIVSDLAISLGIGSCALVTHDMGDSVGGELCARSIEGTLPFAIERRVLTNGSIYMDLVELSPGQLLMLSLPDAVLPEEHAPSEDLFRISLAATFGTETPPDDEVLAAEWALLARDGGHRLLPRLIRYVEQRRVHEQRWTGALEDHRSPLTIIWGDADPIAVYPMAERLHGAVAGSRLVRLKGIGHYPMLEAPAAVRSALQAALA